MLHLALPLLLLAPAPAEPVEQAGVTVYRCTDARGKVELRDTPCDKAKRQQQRQLVRPKDPPPRAARPVAAAAASSASPMQAPQVIMVNSPRAMYECTTPDGKRYTSDSGEGNPRWQPLWTLGYPTWVEGPIASTGGGHIHYRDRHTDIGYQVGGGVQYGVVPTLAAYNAGTWVRDACQPLPQDDICSRLRLRRSELGRQFFNAQPSERARLGAEERSLDARLNSDCGGR